MGAETGDWREACFDCVSFGDVLGGATAQAAITDCGERFIPSPAREILQSSIYMDDLMLGSAGKVDTMIKECDKGSKKEVLWSKNGSKLMMTKIQSSCLTHTTPSATSLARDPR